MSQPKKKQRNTVTVQEKKFCNLYLKCWNYGEAYMAAGYKASSKSARQHGYRLLRTPRVQKYWNSLLNKTDEELLVSRKDIIIAINDIAFGDCDVSPKIRALKLMAQIKGMLIQKVQHSGSINTEVDLSKLTIEELKSLAAMSDQI